MQIEQKENLSSSRRLLDTRPRAADFIHRKRSKPRFLLENGFTPRFTHDIPNSPIHGVRRRAAVARFSGRNRASRVFLGDRARWRCLLRLSATKSTARAGYPCPRVFAPR